MKLINTDGAHALQHAVHGSFTVGDDGFFDVPPELAAELLAFPHWTTDDAHMAEVERIELHELYDPLHAAEVLAGMREDLAVLRAGGTLEPPSTDPVLWTADARTVAWVGMHLRGDAVGIAEVTRIATETWALQLRAAQAAQAAKAPEKAAESAK